MYRAAAETVGILTPTGKRRTDGKEARRAASASAPSNGMPE